MRIRKYNHPITVLTFNLHDIWMHLNCTKWSLWHTAVMISKSQEVVIYDATTADAKFGIHTKISDTIITVS